MKKSLFYLTMITMCCIIFLHPVKSHADNSSSFSVEVDYPEIQNPRVGEAGYFDLLVAPNESYELSLIVKNYSNKPITVVAKAGRATTSEGGALNYQSSLKESSSENKKVNIPYELDMNNLLELKESDIRVEPNDQKKVILYLKSPVTEFKGELLGGVYFTEEPDFEKNRDKTVINQFSYSIPILIRMRDEEKVENNITLGHVGPELRNHHPFIGVELINDKPSIIRNLKVDGKIINKKNDKVVYIKKEDSYQVASYSILNFGFDLQDTPMKSGNYEVDLKIDADGKKYELKKDFVIKNTEAKKFNENAVFVEKEDNSMWFYLIIATLVIIMLIYFINKIRKRI